MLGPFLAILGLVLVFGFILLHVEGLALFAPQRTRGIAPSAEAFCSNGCRLVDGRCPLTGSHEQALNCPLWKFVEADLPTVLYGSPFTPALTGARAVR